MENLSIVDHHFPSFPPMFKTTSKSAFALGLLAAALASAPASQAAGPCGMSYMVTDLEAMGFACSIGDKEYSNFDFSWSDGTFSFDNTPSNRFTFTGTGLGLAPGVHTYSYVVTVVGSPDSFLEYRTDLQSSSNPLPTGSMNELSNTINGNISTATFPNSGNLAALSGTTTKFTGKITVVGVPDVRVDGFTDSLWQTPGPLPLLGAGAAFGFSRKIRNRIKASV